MRGVVAVLFALAVAGCAPMPVKDRFAAMTDMQVCEQYFFGSLDMVTQAKYEAEYRRLDCRQYQQAASTLYQQRIARDAAQAAAMNSMSRQLLAPPPPLIPIQPQVNCTSYRTGNTVQTRCN